MQVAGLADRRSGCFGAYSAEYTEGSLEEWFRAARLQPVSTELAFLSKVAAFTQQNHTQPPAQEAAEQPFRSMGTRTTSLAHPSRRALRALLRMR